MGVEFKGLTEFQTKMQNAINEYPDLAEDLLVKMGNKFRNEVKKNTPIGKEGKKKKSRNKKLISSYKVSKVQGYGQDRFVEFRSVAPHFHLIERGHRIVTKGKNDTGRRTKGQFMVKAATFKFENNEYPKDVKRMVNRMVKKVNG